MNGRYLAALGIVLGAISNGLASDAVANQLNGPPSCVFPDLMTVSAVPIQLGASPPAPADVPIPGGRWELVEIYLTPSLPVGLSGEGRGILEVDASGPLNGLVNNSFTVEGTASPPIGDPFPFSASLPFAGPYQASLGTLSITDQCNDPPLADTIDYRVDTAGPAPTLTLWDAIEVPFSETATITINAELVYLLVDPQVIEDPVFDDRFELP